jgi:hypothetical protein
VDFTVPRRLDHHPPWRGQEWRVSSFRGERGKAKTVFKVRNNIWRGLFEEQWGECDRIIRKFFSLDFKLMAA